MLREMLQPGLRRLRDGSVVARAGAAPRRQPALRRRHLHQSDARPPRLPRRHGGRTSPRSAACSRSCRTAPSASSTWTIAAARTWSPPRAARSPTRSTPPPTSGPGPLTFSLDGLSFDVRTPRGTLHVRSPLVGRPNAYNILAAAAAAMALDLPFSAIEAGVSTPRERARPLPGRLGSRRRRPRHRRLRAHRRRAEEPARDGAAAGDRTRRSPCSAAAAIAIAPSGR